MGAETVFISYSHDSAEHSDRVLALANALIGLGLQVELDQFVTRPPQGWPQWCVERLRPENAKFVLMICTREYCDRVENRVDYDKGRGAYWEGALIHQYICEQKGNTRFIPVLLDDTHEDCVPFPLRPYARYRLRAFNLRDPEFEGLYRELTGQPAVVKPQPGQRAELPPRRTSTAETASAVPSSRGRAGSASPTHISRIDRYAPRELIGREAETKLIEEAWAKAVAGEAQHPRVLTFVALGGEGKTALVAKWAVGMAEKDWPSSDAAFAWSFYSQGSSEQQAAPSDLFLAEALKFFGAPAVEGVESAHDKGRRLAKWIGDKRAALILDGLEPLQYPPTSPTAGELKDEGLRALLKGLAQHNKGLCLVTTRYAIKDLEPYAASAPQRDLAPLSKASGARLLEGLGVRGTRQEREQLSVDVNGHALTLNLIGSYLRDAYGGDIRKRDLIDLEDAAEEQGGHAFRAMNAYVRWFETDGEKGQRALAMLRLMGLFDRAADAGCLEALWQPPAIEGLTEPLIALSEAQRNIVLTRLADAKLATVNRDGSAALVSLDAHPLLREYFAKHLRETRLEAWKAAHQRLFEHLTATPDKDEPTLDDLQPLYQAVAHGCHAGMQQEVLKKVYHDRILRGTDDDGFYSTKTLGAYGADLGAIACFFERPWRLVSSNLAPPSQALLLNNAAYSLRALGRLTDALEPSRAALAMWVAQPDWTNAAITAGNLAELELTLGDVRAAVRDGKAFVAHADRSGHAGWSMIGRSTYAYVVNQAGRWAEAEAHFVEAEAMQAEHDPGRPRLFGLRGFQRCDHLLASAESEVWRRSVSSRGSHNLAASESLLQTCQAVGERAKKTLAWLASGTWLLDIGLDQLTLARASLYRAILRGESPTGEHLKEAADFLYHAGQQDYLPRGLLARALWLAVTGDFDGAQEDLNEAYEIAERGPMRLYLADIHLHRARLFGLMANRPPKYPWVSARDDLDKARKFIDECGYGRRREELDDAEAAWARLYGTPTNFS
jgi:tetratricopeptide (TPR) repeat protein